MLEELKSQKKSKRARTSRVQQFDLLDVTESLGYQTHRKTGGRNCWTKEEDEELRQAINASLQKIGYVNGIADITTIQESMEIAKKISWETLAKQHKSGVRTAKELKKRWTGSLDPNLKRGRWTTEEDDLLIKSYEKYGAKWSLISSQIAGRTDDQCAKRYIEVLGPSSKGRLRDWSLEEDLALIHKVKTYGTKWRKISSEMEFRPSLTCRNRWRKLVTLVVRGQAREEIARAIKEDKDISLSNTLEMEVVDNGQEQKPDSQSTKMEILNMVTMSDNDTLKESTSKIPSSGDMVINKVVVNGNPTGEGSVEVGSTDPTNTGTTKPDQGRPQGTTSQDTLQTSRRPEVLALNTSNLEVYKKIGLPSGVSPDTSTPTEITADMNNSRGDAVRLDPIGELLSKGDELSDARGMIQQHTTEIQQRDTRHQSQEQDRDGQVVPDSQFVKWGVSLESLSGTSVSETAISSKEMVEEIIKQAKNHSLKITIHKHIHNHFGVHPNISKSNDRSTSLAPSHCSDSLLEPHPTKMYQRSWSPSSVPSGLSSLWDNNGTNRNIDINTNNSKDNDDTKHRTVQILTDKYSGNGEQDSQITGAESTGGTSDGKVSFDRDSVRNAVIQMGLPSSFARVTIDNTTGTRDRELNPTLDALRSKTSSASSSESNIASLLNESTVESRNISSSSLMDTYIRGEARLLRSEGQTPVSQVGSYSESSRDITPLPVQDKDGLLDMNGLFLARKAKGTLRDSSHSPDVKPSKRSCNMPDVEPYRVPHFRFLPAALKPQLNSSPNLSNILNPPSSLNAHATSTTILKEKQ